jgi:predicted phage tail protein
MTSLSFAAFKTLAKQLVPFLVALKPALVRLKPDRFTAGQVVSALAAAGGSYLLWGAGVTLFAAGIAGFLASWYLERLSTHGTR